MAAAIAAASRMQSSVMRCMGSLMHLACARMIKGTQLLAPNFPSALQAGW